MNKKMALILWLEFIIYNIAFIMFLPENLRLSVVIWMLMFCVGVICLMIYEKEEIK
jgi:hypothetical protein